MIAIGIIMIIVGAGMSIYGDSLNHDAEAQLESIFSQGKTDPGNGLIGLGVVLIIIGVILVIAGIVSNSSHNNHSSGNYQNYNSNGYGYNGYGYNGYGNNGNSNYQRNMQVLSKEQQEKKLLQSNGWRCTCGVVNPSYTGTCGCGRTKTEVQRKQNEVKQQQTNAAIKLSEKQQQQTNVQKKIESEKEQQDKLVTYNLRLDNIKKMKELLDAGAITQEEFDEKKKQLLDAL